MVMQFHFWNLLDYFLGYHATIIQHICMKRQILKQPNEKAKGQTRNIFCLQTIQFVENLKYYRHISVNQIMSKEI
jgi:hypothetical protein